MKTYGKVKTEFWFTETSGDEHVPLKWNSHYRSRVEYYCISKSCTLKIKDLRESDSAVYKFRFTTDRYNGKYTGEPGVTLSVTDPQVQVNSYSTSRLECHSRCHLPTSPSYVWYKNGQTIQAETLYFYSGHFDPADSFSCALRNHEEFPSPPVCGKGQSCNKVTYTERSICVFKGSSVNISCTYNSYGRIISKFWFSSDRRHQWQNPSQPEDLRKDSQYSGRVQVSHTETGRSTLTITDLRETDSAQYHFTFRTWSFEWTSSLPGTTLTVTDADLQVIVRRYYTSYELKCHSSCRLPLHSSYIWYKNGEKMRNQEEISISVYYSTDSYSCAVKGHEGFPSPSVCVRGQSCNTVTYTDRRICVFKGSSVNISSTYTSVGFITTKFWFRSDRRRQWQNPSQPEDLSKDSQYSGRVQVSHTETGRSTLTITDLRETDSAQYHFTFRTRDFEWTSSLPGTTLTVTALQVQAIRIIRRHESFTEAELKCHSSCSPDGHVAYVWFKNGKKISLEEMYYKDQFYPGDVVSCAFKGHEGFRSPLVYAPKVSVTVASASAEIVEGSSVNLSCTSDANPPANHTWDNKNQGLLSKKQQLVFSSIQSSDSGLYRCTAENELGRTTSEDILIDVKYPPKVPSVSVSPSAEIVEGSSVTLTCSSDSNPAANYTWYKENEDSPKASGQIFTITDFRPEHSGNYSCEAQNTRGRQNSTLHLTVLTSSIKSVAAGSVAAIILVVTFLSVFLFFRKKSSSRQPPGPRERPSKIAQLNVGPEYDTVQREPAEQQEDLVYTTVTFSKIQDDPLYSNVRTAQLSRDEEVDVDYTLVKSESATPRLSEGSEEDPSALYSTVNKNQRT
ncbi:hypothetical protein Q5P01_025645 [Channa striata]|uniref:Ig-like domain-containing protein n=1 Tax=Channa striata TaxID=64152 RepID=A0AA88LIC7_CHASR|nr:hypothetical protein Q5P01_025645 [Channa striata]